jgi:hypothetical protein
MEVKTVNFENLFINEETAIAIDLDLPLEVIFTAKSLKVKDGLPVYSLEDVLEFVFTKNLDITISRQDIELAIQDVKAKLFSIEGTKNIKDDWGAKGKKFIIVTDKIRAQLAGITNSVIAISLQTDMDRQWHDARFSIFLFSFSFVILFTIGFGDITPTTELVRKGIIPEGLLSNFYTVLVVGIVIRKFLNNQNIKLTDK